MRGFDSIRTVIQKTGRIRRGRRRHDSQRAAPCSTRSAIARIDRNYFEDVTVAPITTTIGNLDSEVRLGLEDGMPRECVINCDHIQTLPRHKLGV
jgi:mRNA interferase MazF